MIPPVLFSLLGFLIYMQGGHGLLPPNQLQEMSARGSRYIDTELKEAIDGVRQMKMLMEEKSNDHRMIMNNLEDTKRKKEDALLLAKDMESQLNGQEICNETMLALWEECKPCLKQTCMRFYTRTCHSGAGLVGRQLEEFLNHSSPFSIWVNGERLDSLMNVDEVQSQRLDDLEQGYSTVERAINDLYRESLLDYGYFYPRSQIALGALLNNVWSGSRVARNTHSFSHFPSFYHPHQNFRQMFQPFYGISPRLFEGARRATERDSQWLEESPGSFGPFSTGDPARNDNRMVCREIRHNSAGCLKMKEKCEKCKEILAVDCSQTDPEQTRLKEQFEDALKLAERFTRKYDEILKAFQEEMLNTTTLLDQLNRQFGWVSQLANATRNDKLLQVIKVIAEPSRPEDQSKSDTLVTVQVFDSKPFSLIVPGDIAFDDPKFMDVVAREALREYKDSEAL